MIFRVTGGGSVSLAVVQVLESFVGGWTGGDVDREDDGMSVQITEYKVLGPVKLRTVEDHSIRYITAPCNRPKRGLGSSGARSDWLSGICVSGLKLTTVWSMSVTKRTLYRVHSASLPGLGF